MRSRLAVATLIPLALSLGCSAANPGQGAVEDDLRTTYGDLFETLASEDLDPWQEVRRALIDGFDRVCGDTICSGDYSNLTTIDLKCSSTSVARKLKDCVWVLGGAIDRVDGKSGLISTQPRVFICRVPVVGTAKTMLDQLSAAGEDALDTPLASGKSFYDGLVSCFEGVVGPALPASDREDFKTLSEAMWGSSDEDGARWSRIERRLVKSFDAMCGDSFCAGDFSKISLIEITCPTHVESKNVRSCRLTFGKANTRLGTKGALISDTATQSCDIGVDAPASAVAKALDSDDPLKAKLPGKSTSLYDGLADCL